MIKSLELKNFTVFEHATFELSEGINIIIGENGTGKSHFLKAGYAVIYSYEDMLISVNLYKVESILKNAEKWLRKKTSKSKFSIISKIQLADVSFDLGVIYKEKSINGVKHKNFSEIGEKFISRYHLKTLFIPAKEVLSIYPNFISLYEKYHLSFDETYYDLCKALDNPLLKQLDEPTQALLRDLETIIGGQVILQGGHFYIQDSDSEQLMDISMVAEGHRKIAMLAYLIANDSIVKGCTLFWDEPETNLNPRLMRQLAKALAALAKYGVQVILATHSYFLMKEISLLTQQDNEMPARFFSLAKTEEQGVEVEQADKLTDLQNIVSLDEELDQYDRDQALYYTNKKAS